MKGMAKRWLVHVEYFYSMLTIRRQGREDDVSINMHIISGLNASTLTKPLATMNFTTCSELLVALKNLSAISSASVTSIPPNQPTKTEIKNKYTQIKCFNCNELGHMAAKCPQP